MRSTYPELNVHLVWGTKNQLPLIDTSWRKALHFRIRKRFREAGAIPDAIDGIEDHVHALVRLKATHRLCDLLHIIKRESSRSAHKSLGRPEFRWQDGYGAFSVNRSIVPHVIKYIENQERPHGREVFADELRRIVVAHGIPWDPSMRV